MKRYYVGIAGSGQRAVFRSKDTPEAKTHGSIYNAVIGPFRTKRATYIMAEYGANNPHLQTVADAERIARENHIDMQRVYAASAWWHDSDTFCTVVGNSRPLVEKTIYKAMRQEAIDAYNSSEPEDKKRVRDFLNDIGWSGVNAFTFDALISKSIINQYEEAYSSDADTVAHHPDMDYSDYAMLRDGRKDVVVYV